MRALHRRMPCRRTLTTIKRRTQCQEGMEPDLSGEPVGEREEGWVGDAAREPVLELEGWAAPERVQVLRGNAYARNVAPPFLTSAAYPAIR